MFRNGSISGTGIKKIENGEISVGIILERIKRFSDEIVSIDNNPGLMNEDCAVNNYSIALINSDYEVAFDIKRINLYSLLVNRYKIFSSYEPCIYPGVNTKYFLNTDYANREYRKASVTVVFLVRETEVELEMVNVKKLQLLSFRVEV